MFQLWSAREEDQLNLLWCVSILAGVSVRVCGMWVEEKGWRTI